MGSVVLLHKECFEVKRPRGEGDPICIKSEAIFTVDKREGVTLLCSTEDVARYAHPVHPAEPGPCGDRADQPQPGPRA